MLVKTQHPSHSEFPLDFHWGEKKPTSTGRKFSPGWRCWCKRCCCTPGLLPGASPVSVAAQGHPKAEGKARLGLSSHSCLAAGTASGEPRHWGSSQIPVRGERRSLPPCIPALCMAGAAQEQPDCFKKRPGCPQGWVRRERFCWPSQGDHALPSLVPSVTHPLSPRGAKTTFVCFALLHTSSHAKGALMTPVLAFSCRWSHAGEVRKHPCSALPKPPPANELKTKRKGKL